jgi:hypothetical protein
MVRVVHTAISCFDSILDEAQSPDQSGNNVSNLNELVFYHLIWWNLGNPTVRDRRGACGNVDDRKSRAPQFYPDPPQPKRARRRRGGERVPASRQASTTLHAPWSTP